MATEMNKTYNPSEIEDRLYKKWLDKKYFHAEVDRSKKPFTIVMPPPNITGQLHMGHDGGCACGVGGQPHILRPVPDKQQDQEGEGQAEQTLRPEGETQAGVLDGCGEQGRGQDGGDARSGGHQTQGEAPPVLKPPGDHQGEGDHPPVAVGQPGEHCGGAVGEKAVGCAEQKVGEYETAQPGHDHPPQAIAAAQGVRRGHGQHAEQAACGGDPGALGVGEVLQLQQIGLVHGEGVDPQTHNGEQGQAASQAYQPGPPGGCTPGPRRDRI